MHVAILDDDACDREMISRLVRAWSPTCSISSFSNGDSLLDALRKASTPQTTSRRKPAYAQAAELINQPFDAAIIDIYLPEGSGMDVARAVRKLYPSTHIVFVTNSTEHAIEAFAIDALHYIVKPITAMKVAQAMDRVVRAQSARTQEASVLTVSLEHATRIISLDAIYLLQSADHLTEITLANGETLRTWKPLAKLSEQLDERFVTVKRGVMANMDHIERMSTESCQLSNGVNLQISRKRRASVHLAYENYAFARLAKQRSYNAWLGDAQREMA